MARHGYKRRAPAPARLIRLPPEPPEGRAQQPLSRPAKSPRGLVASIPSAIGGAAREEGGEPDVRVPLVNWLVTPMHY